MNILPLINHTRVQPRLSIDLPDIPGLNAITGANAGAAISAVQALPDDVQEIVNRNYVRSMRMIWIFISAFAAVGLLASFAIGAHELHRELNTLSAW